MRAATRTHRTRARGAGGRPRAGLCEAMPRSVMMGSVMASVMTVLLHGTCGLDNGLGLTPPLGYNAYDHVGCCANETTMKQQGQALIDLGFRELGYNHVNMDCGWMGGRHANGTLYESPSKFREFLPFRRCCWRR